MNALKQSDKQLLQRHYDGEASEFDDARAEKLLESSAAARTFIEALSEIELAARGAEELLWEQAPRQDGAALMERARDGKEEELPELAPLLERYHDEELMLEEHEFVAGLLQEREDVADYVGVLGELKTGLRAAQQEALEGVDFGGFFDGLSSRLDDIDDDQFDAEEHRVLLHRYHDEEASESERARVDAWRESGQAEVVETLSALDELQVALQASVELTQERVEFHDLWTSIEARLEDEEEAGEVISLEERRHQAQQEEQAEPRAKVSFLGEYRQGLMAVAATLTIVAFGGLMFGNIFGPERVVVKEKTIVIVDDLQHANGTSVMVTSPIQEASMRQDGSSGPSMKSEGSEGEDTPTIIWMLDQSSPDGASADEGEGPKAKEDKAGSEDASGDKEDDLGSRPQRGQPI